MEESKCNEAYHSLRYFTGNMSLNLKLSFLPGWGNNADYFDGQLYRLKKCLEN